MNINFTRLNPYAHIFEKQYDSDACYDVFAGAQLNSQNEYIYLDANKEKLMPWQIPAHSVKLIKTGICLEIPNGYCGIIKGRSGLSKSGVLVQTGTIDAGYRGDIGIAIYNAKDTDIAIYQGDRIAQFCILPVYSISFTEVNELNPSDRGKNGYGSTGGYDPGITFSKRITIDASLL